MRKYIVKIMALVVAISMMTISVSAATPRFNNVGNVSLFLNTDNNNVIYIGLSVETYSHGSGVSGLMKLFDSAGTCVAIWSVSDYEKPIGVEFTYQGVRRETYTAQFHGYAYSNNGTAADRIEIENTITCR